MAMLGPNPEILAKILAQMGATPAQLEMLLRSMVMPDKKPGD